MCNFRHLGLALVFVAAISVMGAPAALAQEGQVTSDGPVILSGTELTGNSFTYPGLPEATCSDSTFQFGSVDTTPHGAVSSGSKSLTSQPVYRHCKIGIFPATWKTTKCDYNIVKFWFLVFYLIKCEQGDKFHIEAYSDAAHTNRICTITFGEQEPTSELTFINNEGTLILSGQLTGIEATKSGGGCGGAGETTEAKYTVNVEVFGESEEEESTPISISEVE